MSVLVSNTKAFRGFKDLYSREKLNQASTPCMRLVIYYILDENGTGNSTKLLYIQVLTHICHDLTFSVLVYYQMAKIKL